MEGTQGVTADVRWEVMMRAYGAHGVHGVQGVQAVLVFQGVCERARVACSKGSTGQTQRLQW